MNSELSALLDHYGLRSLDRVEGPAIGGPAHSLGPELRAWVGANVPRPGQGVLE